MSSVFVYILVIICAFTHNSLPEKTKNRLVLEQLAQQGNSDAECLLGIQEMIGGDDWGDGSLSDVEIGQMLSKKIYKWEATIEFLPPYEKGSEYSSGNKADKCLTHLKKAADKKNKYALFCIGKMFALGIGNEKDPQEAITNFNESARLGNSRAYFGLFILYLQKNDVKKAIEYLQRGYDEGDPDCKIAKGTEMLYGRLLAKDENEGFKMIEQGYHDGSKHGGAMLGLCYAEGRGAHKDPSKAFILFKESADSSKSAKLLLGKAYFEGIGTQQDKQKGIEIIEAIAELNEPNAMLLLSLIYTKGDGVQVDYKRAYDLLNKAANQGHPQAMGELGRAFYLGSIVKSDKMKAVYWLQKAADAGDQDAETLLYEAKKSSP